MKIVKRILFILGFPIRALVLAVLWVISTMMGDTINIDWKKGLFSDFEGAVKF